MNNTIGTPVIHRIIMKFWKISLAYSKALGEIDIKIFAIEDPSSDNLIEDCPAELLSFNIDNTGPETITTGKK